MYLGYILFFFFEGSSCLRLEDHPKEAHVKLIQDVSMEPVCLKTGTSGRASSAGKKQTEVFHV